MIEFLHRLSTFTLGPEEGRLCSSHGSEALTRVTDIAVFMSTKHIHSRLLPLLTHSLKTSPAPYTFT